MANDNHPVYLLRSSEELRRPTVYAFPDRLAALRAMMGEATWVEPGLGICELNVRIFEQNKSFYDPNGDTWRAIELPVPAPANPEKLSEEELQFLTTLVGRWIDSEARDQFWNRTVSGSPTERVQSEKLRKAEALLKKLRDLPVFEEART